MSYDLFVSYARTDNQRGQVAALREQIEADYRAFAGQELHCFFDADAIASMDDWRHRILQGLSESSLLLLVLSPAYLDSLYCAWEVVEFLKYEHARSVGGQGVAPVYFVEIPALDDPDFELRAASWVARVRRRNHVDLRPWYDEGRRALERLDVRGRLADLEHSLHARLTRLRRLRSASGNLPVHNPHFVGREIEMQRLHESVALGRFGVLTTVQGVGGLGKTALAIQYACAYADFYPGGRWLVGCAGHTTLAAALGGLDFDLGVTFDDSEKRDDQRAARRILAELERRAVEGARLRAGEKDPPEARALLLLDNVDSAALLRKPGSDLIAGRAWLRVLATTRLGGDELDADSEVLTLLSIDELPEVDALRLVESYQPDGRFCSPEERAAALKLVRLLGGFTLAVEVVAVHLGERAGRVSCAAFLARMEKEGLDALDAGAGRAIKSGLRHGEKLIGPTLQPTLDLLSDSERCVLGYAALLPPDTVPVPWLRTLAAAEDPALARDAEPGYEDAWLALVNHLLGLRLLQIVDLDATSRAPRVVRMHRVLGQVVRTLNGPAACADGLRALVGHALERSDNMERHWFEAEAKWEIEPFVAFAEQLLADGHEQAPELVKYLGEWFYKLGDWTRKESITRRAIAVLESRQDADERELAILASNLGGLLVCEGRHLEAEPFLRRALETDERLREPDHPFVQIRLNNLAFLLEAVGAYEKAEPLYRRALATRERVLGPDHPRTLTSVDHLAALLTTMGAYAEAEPLSRRALAARKLVLGPEHPDTLRSLGNLARLLESKGEYAEAEPLSRQALAGCERVLGPEHPETLTSVNNLAALLKDTRAYAEAELLYRRALAGSERVLGPEHPDTLTRVNNLAELLKDTGAYAEAERLYGRALAGLERVLGPEHPHTLTSVNNLAALLQATGAYAEAEPLYRRALAASERVLGPEHPETLTSVNNLAALLHETEAYPEAEPLYRRALAGRERVLGPEHPDTLAAGQGLADVLEKTGRAEEARSLRTRRLRALVNKADVTPLDLRTAALDAYRLSDYPLAATLLQRVLDAGFEIPGTCCHLARIALLQDDVPSARARVAHAWEQRSDAPPYVVPRILWLELACELAVNPDQSTARVTTMAGTNGRLKSALVVPGAHMEWAMDPVLDHLRSRVPGDAHAMLTALVAALGDPAKVGDLDAFAAWRDARPEPEAQGLE